MRIVGDRTDESDESSAARVRRLEGVPSHLEIGACSSVAAEPRSSGFGHFRNKLGVLAFIPRWTEPVAFRQFIWTGRRLSIRRPFAFPQGPTGVSPLSKLHGFDRHGFAVALGAACRRWRSRSGRRYSWSLTSQREALR